MVDLYITDRFGGRHFGTSVAYDYHTGELHNMQQRLAWAKAGKVKSIDPATARLVMKVDGEEQTATAEDLDLLEQLGL